jgi:DNA-binding IclR family transcriptional regulator
MTVFPLSGNLDFPESLGRATVEERHARKWGGAMAGNSTNAGRSVTSKVIAILMTFRTGDFYSLTEIARLTGLPISTAHRLAVELVDWGMLQRTGEGQFRIGAQLCAIASQATAAVPNLHERARRVMEDLAAAADRAVVRLGVPQGLDVLFLEKKPGGHPVPVSFGSATMPLHATAMGRALLAFASSRLIDVVIEHGLTRYTPYTVTEPEELRHALSVIRLTRVAVCRREYESEFCAAAVPVFGVGGRIVAALELSLRDGQDLRLVRPPLIVAGRALTRELQSAAARPSLTISAARQFETLVNLKAG